jgi:Histidine kinase
MTKKSRQILLRTIGSVLFMMLPILSSPNHALDVMANLSNPEGLKEIFVYALYLLFFFVHHDYIIPAFFFQKKYIAYAGLMGLSWAIVVLVPSLMVTANFNEPLPPPIALELRPERAKDMPPPPPQYKRDVMRPPMPLTPILHPKMPFWIQFSRYLPMFLVVLFVSLAMRINNRWREVEQEKTNAELAYLKAQVNPHFLFNTLNSIYALSIEKSDETPNAITQLSSMMRYVLNETNKEFVSLEKEINYISDYIALQKLRFGDTIKLKYSVIGKPHGKQIAPLILITFIENAFKHGVNPEEPTPILIEIDIPHNELVLTVDNKKAPARQGDYTLKSGLGIENARNRLQLLYPSKHELIIADSETDYLICLKINLT